jgi:hypothetical protein
MRERAGLAFAHSRTGGKILIEMPPVEQILEQVRNLPPEDRARVLSELQSLEADRVFGKYAEVPTSSDAFCKRKRDEVDLENPTGLHS